MLTVIQAGIAGRPSRMRQCGRHHPSLQQAIIVSNPKIAFRSGDRPAQGSCRKLDAEDALVSGSARRGLLGFVVCGSDRLRADDFQLCVVGGLHKFEAGKRASGYAERA